MDPEVRHVKKMSTAQKRQADISFLSFPISFLKSTRTEIIVRTHQIILLNFHQTELLSSLLIRGR